MVQHVDITFAGSSIEDLEELVSEYESLVSTGTLADDSALREKGVVFGRGQIGVIMAGLSAYREIVLRQRLEK